MRLTGRTSASRLLVLSAFFLFAACDSSTEPSTPSTITATSGATITGRVGEQKTVIVSVAASNGRALANQTVAFAVTSGGGTVSAPSVTSDASGQASTTWTLGNAIGAQILTASVGGITQTVTATVSAGLPAALTIQQGGGQTAPAGTALPTSPAFIVRDAGGNPVQGVQVTFSVSPGGSVAPASATTDASGIARVTNWTLGNQAGTYTLTATALGANITGNPATITATATAGAAARIQPIATLPTTATAGSALSGASLPAVTVVDANGNPVSGVAVTFNVTSGGGALTGATATTNAQGVATVGGFTLGTTAGPNIIQVSATGAGTTNIVITGTAGAAASTQIVSGNNQQVRAGQPLQVGPSVRVVDRNGNPVAGATVNFVVTGGGGSVLGATQTTNAAGIATVGGYTLGLTPGTNTLVARVAGLADVTFTAIGQAGAPVTIRKISGDSLSVNTFQAASQPFVVEVLDADGFKVSGATVTFTLSNSGGGTVTPASATTDTSGRARATFTANGVLGQNIVSATVGNLPPVQFVITTNATPAGSVVAVQGNNQVATVGTGVPVNPSVQVRDAAGNPVPGVTVFFETFGAGGVQFGAPVTDANGVASAGTWTLGGTAGVNTLSATVSAAGVSGNPIIFRATGITVPAGATIAPIPNLTPANAPVGSAVNAGVQVKDASGNPLANLTVLFQVTSGGGSIPGTPTGAAGYLTVTDANGFARVPSFVLGSTIGLNTLTANLINGGATTAITVNGQ